MFSMESVISVHVHMKDSAMIAPEDGDADPQVDTFE